MAVRQAVSDLGWRMLAQVVPWPDALNCHLAYTRGYEAARGEQRPSRRSARELRLAIALRQLVDSLEDTNPTARGLAIVAARRELDEEERERA